MALIGNDSQKAYEIIVYKDRQNILTKAKLDAPFTYTLHRDSFASFFDDQKQNWFVLFENAKDYTEFSRELEKRNIKIVENLKKPDEAMKQNPPKIESKHDEGQSDSSETQMKANILSRMAKMGQPILPVSKAAGVSDYADSESDDSNISRKSRKTKRTEKPPIASGKPEIPKPKQLPVTRPSTQSLPSAAAEIVPVQSTLSHYVVQPGQMILNHNMVSPTVDPLNVLLAENRTHNCEVRMNLSQLSNKVDEVLRKMDNDKGETAEEKMLRAKVKALELKVANLTAELEEAMNCNAELEQKIMDSRNSSVVNNVHLERRDEFIQKQNQILEVLEEKLQEKDFHISVLKEQNASYRESKLLAKGVVNMLENNGLLMEDFKKVYDEHKDDEMFLKCLYEDLYQQIVILKQSENQGDEQSTSVKVKSFTEKLNIVMQDFQQYIVKHFDSSSNTFPEEFITKLLPKSIRTATNYLIRELENEFVVSNSTAELKNEASVSELSD